MKGKILVTALAAILLLGTVPAFAGNNANEVGAFLVFPAIIALEQDPIVFESLVTVTNTSADPIFVHFAYIDGEDLPTPQPDTYCEECNFSIPLTGFDTETLVVTFDGAGIVVQSEADGPIPNADPNAISVSCDFRMGFMIATVEDAAGNTLQDNILHGEQVVVNYTGGYALSMPAISIQGGIGGNGDKTYVFDNLEYMKLPTTVAADFIAPDALLTAELALVSLNFQKGIPPFTSCSINAYDADENPFSRQLDFGCWMFGDLQDISGEFAYPNLGQSATAMDTHGWLQLNCTSNGQTGGVHGAIIQRASPLAEIRRNAVLPPAFANDAAWARLLYQSVTPGNTVTLNLQ